MHCSGFLHASPLLSISPSITLPHTDRSTKKENAHTLMLKNPVKKKDEGFPAHSSLHLFLCRLSVLIRPSVISASIYLAFCRLWITSPHPTPSFCVCLPLSCLPWWKEMSGSFIYISLSLSFDLNLYLKHHYTWIIPVSLQFRINTCFCFYSSYHPLLLSD